ncbi:hypothetical protein ACLBYD_07660 [Rhodococcus sp. C26F]
MSVLLSLIAALVLALGGTIDEDSPLFDCRIHGNAICGPGATVYGEPAN